MKWIILIVFLKGATGTVYEAMIDMDVNKYASYEACQASAVDLQKKWAADPNPMKVFCWRIDMENSGFLSAGGFEPAKNSGDILLPSRKR